MRELKQSTAANLMIFMTDSADHVSGKTGLTLTITASKDGAAFGSITPTVTERGNGWYSLALTTSHTDTLGDFALHVTGTGADPADTKALVITLDKAASGGKVPATIAAGDIATDALTAAALKADAVAEIQSGLMTAADSNVAAIKAKTDNLPSDPADASDIAAAFSTVNSTLTTIASYIDTEVAAIKAKTDNLPGDPADASDIAASFSSIATTLSTIAGYIDTEVAAIKAKTDNLPSDPADASDIAGAFSTVNSTLATMAGYIDTEVAAIKAKTDNLPAAPAAVGDIPTANQNADALLKRDWTSVTGEAARSALNALRFLRNKWSISGSTLTVTKEDDSTTAFTASMSSDADAEPITGSDPS